MHSLSTAFLLTNTSPDLCKLTLSWGHVTFIIGECPSLLSDAEEILSSPEVPPGQQSNQKKLTADGCHFISLFKVGNRNEHAKESLALSDCEELKVITCVARQYHIRGRNTYISVSLPPQFFLKLTDHTSVTQSIH